MNFSTSSNSFDSKLFTPVTIGIASSVSCAYFHASRTEKWWFEKRNLLTPFDDNAILAYNLKSSIGLGLVSFITSAFWAPGAIEVIKKSLAIQNAIGAFMVPYIACGVFWRPPSEGINQPDQNGVTPLIQAAKMVDLDMVKYFVKKGADVNMKDRNGLNAFGWAFSHTYYHSQGNEIKDPETKDPETKYPEIKYPDIKGLKVMRYLLKNGASVDTKYTNFCKDKSKVAESEVAESYDLDDMLHEGDIEKKERESLLQAVSYNLVQMQIKNLLPIDREAFEDLLVLGYVPISMRGAQDNPSESLKDCLDEDSLRELCKKFSHMSELYAKLVESYESSDSNAESFSVDFTGAVHKPAAEAE